MGLKDVFLTPIYLFFVYAIAIYIRDKYYKNHVLRSYLIPALTVKIIGAICLGLVYHFYYHGGDTTNYFSWDTGYIMDAFNKDPLLGLSIIFSPVENFTPENFAYTSPMMFFDDAPSFFIVRICAFLSLFCFHTYSVVAVFFAIISFLGVWPMFVSFCRIYPSLHKDFAIAILFMPSVVFWGSGIMKDSITLGALGFIFSAVHMTFAEKKFSQIQLWKFLLGAYILVSVKIYILICFVPTMVYYVFLIYNYNVKNKLVKRVTKPLLILIGITIGYFASAIVSKEDKRYELDNMVETSRYTAQGIKMASKHDQGSTYELSELFDGTIGSFLKLAPQAIIVTFFRPFIWETRNPLMLISAMEGMYVFYLTFFSLKQYLDFKKRIELKPIIVPALGFAIMFGIAVGMSTYNFGSLVRYKIPAMPFFVAIMVILKNVPKLAKQEEELKQYKMLQKAMLYEASKKKATL